jgi:hypothetical protein
MPVAYVAVNLHGPAGGLCLQWHIRSCNDISRLIRAPSFSVACFPCNMTIHVSYSAHNLLVCLLPFPHTVCSQVPAALCILVPKDEMTRSDEVCEILMAHGLSVTRWSDDAVTCEWRSHKCGPWVIPAGMCRPTRQRNACLPLSALHPCWSTHGRECCI